METLIIGTLEIKDLKKINLFVGKFLKNGILDSALSDSSLIIEDIDHGLHFSLQKSFWNKVFKEVNESKRQLFATTHSYEMIKYLSQAYEEEGRGVLGEDEIRLFTITKDSEGQNKAYKYDSEMIKYAIDDQMEVRS
jgi:AAA15 family ATPase/GTPase